MTTDNPQLVQIFLDTARRALIQEHWPRISECVCSLTEEQIWWRPNEASNCIGNLLLHLNGNIDQWIVCNFNRTEDRRNRPCEFSEQGPMPGGPLLARLGGTVEEAGAVLARLTAADLEATYQIQGYTCTGLYAVFHAVEHFAEHYGQIAYITKAFKNKDLGFFRELDKTGRAK